MPVSIIKQPDVICFSRNPVWFGLQTDNLYANQGQASTFLLDFAAPLTEGAFNLTFNGKTQTFTVDAAADDTGLTLRPGEGLTLLQWCEQVVEDLSTNYLLSKYYDLSVDLTGAHERVKFLAKSKDTVFDLSVNDQPYVALVSLVNGAKRERNAKFAIYAEVWIENDKHTGFDLVQDNLFLDVDDNGKAYPNLSQTLTDALLGQHRDFERPDPGLPVISRNYRSCRRYYLRYGEAYGVKQTIRKLHQTPIKWVTLGGTGKPDQDSYLLTGNFIAGGYLKFLKQGPAVQRVCLPQPEYLSLILLSADVATLRVKVKTYFTGGDPVEHEAYQLAGCLQYDKVSFACGPNQLNLTGLYLAKLITHYEVWCADDAGVRISEVRTYQMNYEVYEAARFFLAHGSLGSYETFICTGFGSKQYELSMQRATLSRSSNFSFADGETIEFDASLQYTEQVATGFLSKHDLHRYRDLFLSWDKYQVRNNRLYPVQINSKSIKESRDGNTLYSLVFETGYRYQEQNWGLDGDDGDPMEPLAAGVYLPPVSNPAPENFDHLYYRKDQVPNNAEFNAAIDTILQTEADHHAEHAALIDALQAALAGKSDINHHHDERYPDFDYVNQNLELLAAGIFYRGEWQADYSPDPDDEEVLPGYEAGAHVAHKKCLWLSLTDENTNEPGKHSSWKLIAGIYAVELGVSDAINIAWQTDSVPDGPITFAELFGNTLPVLAGHYTESTVDDTVVSRAYQPNIRITKTAASISLIEITDAFPGTITLYCIK